MKNWFHKFGVILIMILVTGLLSGCSAGSTVETTLTINEDLSGTRVMELVIDQSVFDEYFNGTIEDLNAAATEGCPADLTWVHDDSTGINIYTVTLSFTSPQDYKEKVDRIIGEGSDVQIVMSKSDSVWASGVMVDESFSSGDLLNWLKTLLVEKGLVSSSNASDIFELDGNKVLFAGEEYTTRYNDISIDEIEYLSINSIDMLTDAKEYDCYDKTIVISIPESSMEKKGEEIKTWLEARVPSGATGEWTTDDDSNSIYTVSKEDMTAEQLEVFLNEYFDSDACVVTQDDITEDMSPFSFNIGLYETVDFTNYVVGDRAYYTDINYYVKGENGYVGGRYLDDLIYYADNDEDDYYSDYEGYRNGGSDYGEGNLTPYYAYFQKVYKVDEVNIETNIGFFGGLSRTISFTLDGQPTDEEKTAILDKINALGVAYDMQQAQENTDSTESATEVEPTTDGEASTGTDAAPQWKVKVSEKVEEDDYIITIEQSGSREEIKASTEALFGHDGDLYAVKDFAFFKPTYDVAVYDDFSLGDFVDYTTEDADARYVLKTGFGSKMEFANIEEAKTDGSEVTLKKGVLDGVSMVCYGTQLNLWAVFFYLFIVIALVSVVIAVFKSGIINVKKTAQPQQEVTYQEAPQTRFCGNCGAKYAEGAVFCPECGSKV